MKKFFYMMFLTLAFVACQNEEILDRESVNEENETSIQLVLIEEGSVIPFSQARSEVGKQSYALKFADEDVYASTMAYLEGLSSNERIAFVKGFGLESLQELSVIADAELEIIGTNASNEADFREKYKAYKDKYAGILVANSYDTDDLSLYVPDGDNLNTYLINNTKNIVVGNEIRYIELVNDMGESDKNSFTYCEQNMESRVAAWYTNEFNVKYADNNKKLIFSVTIPEPAKQEMKVHIGAQKKMWYGWKRDTAREFYFESYLDNFIYLAYNGTTPPVSVPRSQRYCYKDCDGQVNLILGKKGTLTSSPISGKMYIWTDLIAEKDANGNLLSEYVSVWNGSQMVSVPVVKCLESKAFGVNVNLN
jgi:hypothetical protein